MKINNIWQTIREYNAVPKGFHVEIWSRREDDGSVSVWTSEYLSQNSWTTNHPEDEKRLDVEMRWRVAEEDVCKTEALRRAVLHAYRDSSIPWGEKAKGIVLAKDRTWDGATFDMGGGVRVHVHEWESSESEDWEPDEDGYVPTGYVYADVDEQTEDGTWVEGVDGAVIGYSPTTTLGEWMKVAFHMEG